MTPGVVRTLTLVLRRKIENLPLPRFRILCDCMNEHRCLEGHQLTSSDSGHIEPSRWRPETYHFTNSVPPETVDAGQIPFGGQLQDFLRLVPEDLIASSAGMAGRLAVRGTYAEIDDLHHDCG
jgi:hypothetical protein